MPVLNPAGAPRVAALATDLVRETRGRGRFSAFPEEGFSAAAGILVRYGIHSMEVIRQTQKNPRTLFLRDLAAYFIGFYDKIAYCARGRSAGVSGHATFAADSRPISTSDSPG